MGRIGSDAFFNALKAVKQGAVLLLGVTAIPRLDLIQTTEAMRVTEAMHVLLGIVCGFLGGQHAFRDMHSCQTQKLLSYSQCC